MKFFLFLLGFSVVMIPALLIFYLTTPSKRTKGKWEAHTCKLPTSPDLANIGKVWQCKCGRRWKYLRTSHDYPYDKNIWEERTPEMELAEAEAKLRKMDKGKL
jgi:hypothetical protein